MPVLKVHIDKKSKIKLEEFIRTSKAEFLSRDRTVAKMFEEEEQQGWFFSYESHLIEESKIIQKLLDNRFEIYSVFEKEIEYSHKKILKTLFSIYQRTGSLIIDKINILTKKISNKN